MGCNCKRGTSLSSRNIVKRSAPRDSVRSTRSGGRIVRRIIK
jgi:hypothetical protein